MAEASTNALMAGLARLVPFPYTYICKHCHSKYLLNSASVYDSSKYSDLTIRCRDRDFKVHRAVVCPRSTFFAAACDGCFKASLRLSLQ